jgi:proliferating cell nuclear antigen
MDNNELNKSEFEIRLNNDAGKWVTGAVETSGICSELFLMVDDGKLKLVNLDMAHIQYYELLVDGLDCDLFLSSGPVKKTVDAEELIKVFKRWRSGYSITLKDDNIKSALNIVFSNLKGVRKEFNIKYVDLDYEIPTAPELDFISRVIVDLNDIKEVIGDLDTINDKFNIGVAEGELYLSSHGEFGDLKVGVPDKNFNIPDDCQSVINLDKFRDTVRRLKNKTELELEIGNNHPLGTRAPYGLSSFMRVLTAPCIEEEV